MIQRGRIGDVPGARRLHDIAATRNGPATIRIAGHTATPEPAPASVFAIARPMPRVPPHDRVSAFKPSPSVFLMCSSHCSAQS